jgi:hypothetical protein
MSTLRRRQVVEKWRRCGGSIESISVVRDSFREEQLLQPLLVVERRLDPQVRGARQNAFCEGQDALYVEFIDGFGVVIDLGERQLLAEPVALPFVALRVDALHEQERLVQAIELLLDDLDALLLLRRPVLRFGPSLFPDVENPVRDQIFVVSFDALMFAVVFHWRV